MSFPFQRGAEVKNLQSITSTPKHDDRHKKKEIKE